MCNKRKNAFCCDFSGIFLTCTFKTAASTSGIGQKLDRGTSRTNDGSPRYWTDALNMLISPGFATTRCATSRWMINAMTLGRGEFSRKRRKTIDVILNGRLETNLYIPSSNSSSIRISRIFPSISRNEGSSPNRFFNATARRRSSSTATTDAPRSSNRPVTAPNPGPISSTVSPFCTSAASTSASTASLSIRKFWPFSCFGRTAARCISSFSASRFCCSSLEDKGEWANECSKSKRCDEWISVAGNDNDRNCHQHFCN